MWRHLPLCDMRGDIEHNLKKTRHCHTQLEENKTLSHSQCVDYTSVVLYVLIGRVGTNSVIHLDLASAKTTDNQNILRCEKCLLDHCVRPRRRQEEGGIYLTTWCQMSPYISHRGKCLHTYHMVVNVSIHITQR